VGLLGSDGNLCHFNTLLNHERQTDRHGQPDRRLLTANIMLMHSIMSVINTNIYLK